MGSVRPLATLVMACYRVADYLPAFFASLESQTAAHEDYELWFVVDGNVDHSAEIIQSWAEQCDYKVAILTKGNGGVASARNAGIERAKGEWISFPDPDDTLTPTYLQAIAEAQRAFPGEKLFVGRIRLLSESGRAVVHPLDFKYRSTTPRVVDLHTDPDDIQTLGGVVFFHLDEVLEHGLAMNTRLPTASDADFIMQFLLSWQAKYVLVPNAEYQYRRRADGSSIVKTQEANVGRYKVVFGETHPALLLAAGPECPQWLANTLLYFVFYLFRRNLQPNSPIEATPPADLEIIRTQLQSNLRRIGREKISAFRIFDVPIEVRMAWLAQSSSGLESSPVVRLRDTDANGAQRVGIYSSRPIDDDAIVIVEPEGRIIGRKVRSVDFLGARWVDELILEIEGLAGAAPTLATNDTPTLELGGRAMWQRQIRRQLGQTKPPSGSQSEAHGVSSARSFFTAFKRRVKRFPYSIASRAVSLGLRSGLVKPAIVYVSASGAQRRHLEALFEIYNSKIDGAHRWWYVSDSVDRNRPYPLRRIRRGSLRHFMVMKASRICITESIDGSAIAPFSESILQRSWRLLYIPGSELQSADFRRLNQVDGFTLIVPSADERARVVDDHTGYRLMDDDVLVVPGIRGPQAGAAWQLHGGEILSIRGIG